jgi:hypothetical protein
MNPKENQPFFHVIMPLYSDKLSDQKIEIIRSIADDHNLLAHFPTYSKDSPVFDLNATIRTYQKALFILADLSFERPSCYYELGIAEASGSIIYLIAAKGTEIHQTTHKNSLYFYSDLDQLREIIIEILVKDKTARKVN